MIKCSCESQEICTCKKGVVCVKHVSFYRGPRCVLDNITFCIDQGVFLGIIGPNGGGKTTLLKILLGVLPVQSGTIELFGHDLSNSAEVKSMIGYVPQRSVIDQNFPASALDVVLMGATAKTGLFKKISKETISRAKEMLDMVGLADLASRPIGRMSGGQQQRVFIARALINQPRLLILDEPTVGVDSANQQRFLHMIEDLKSRFELTIIMVSHDIGQLTHYADQVACLNKRLHWHNRSELLTSDVLDHVYSCEMDAYKEKVKELL